MARTALRTRPAVAQLSLFDPATPGTVGDAAQLDLVAYAGTEVLRVGIRPAAHRPAVPGASVCRCEWAPADADADPVASLAGHIASHAR